MLPADVALWWTLRFVRAAVEGRRRVLEVGCGDGRLAARLAGAGHEVTALNRDLSRAAPEAEAGVELVEADFLRFEARPFDAVVFASSLHHVAPLGSALARAAGLLAADGVLAVDDFDVAAPDEETARWRYRAEAGLAGSGLAEPEADDGAAEAALARWRREHEAVPPLHPGGAMLEAIRRGFADARSTSGPYLFRYACAGLAATPAAGRAAVALLRKERRAIAAATIRPVGLRILARRSGDRAA